MLWTFDLDGNGEVESFHVERALIYSQARLDYEGAHADLAAGRLHPSIALLPEVGRMRQESSLRREAISLRLPSQRVVENDDGTFELIIEPRYEVMDYNSEISLLAGMCAGRLMQEAGVGFLRTLPAAEPEHERQFRAEAQALGFALGDAPIPQFLLTVDAASPRGMAVMREAQSLLRGADYAWLGEQEAQVHAGIGGYYAHVTAPLRRLCDRFATEVYLALCGGYEVPEWVRASATEVIGAMRSTSQLASQVDKACLNLTEATVLRPWLGTNFPATVVRGDPKRDKARILSRSHPSSPPAWGRQNPAASPPCRWCRRLPIRGVAAPRTAAPRCGSTRGCRPGASRLRPQRGLSRNRQRNHRFAGDGGYRYARGALCLAGRLASVVANFRRARPRQAAGQLRGGRLQPSRLRNYARSSPEHRR